MPPLPQIKPGSSLVSYWPSGQGAGHVQPADRAIHVSQFDSFLGFCSESEMEIGNIDLSTNVYRNDLERQYLQRVDSFCYIESLVDV